MHPVYSDILIETYRQFTVGEEGEYQCKVTNTAGTAASNLLLVRPTPAPDCLVTLFNLITDL